MAIIASTEGFFAGDMDPGSRWLAAIGALLPALRVEAWQQVKNEKAAATETRR